MLSLQRVAMFIAVVESGSFTAAAASLRQTKAAISINIRQLEAELGVSLLVRSTRRLALTQAGEVFYQRSKQLLQQAESLVGDIQLTHSGFSGELRITSTPEYGQARVIPALAAFTRLHPHLQVRFVSSSHHADLISERFDVAIRLGTLADSSYRAALIDRFSVFAVASPQWLAEHPIDSLQALATTQWIIHNRLADPLNWTLHGPEDQPEQLAIRSPIHYSADSSSALLGFALTGCGVTLLPEWLAGPHIAAGTLQRVLPEWQFPPQGIYAVYPDTRHVPARVRAFIDFLRHFHVSHPAITQSVER
ncbi:LysR family transcriptional regulator [Candidatus Pantoea multigeneris]|uniref:LysR family transcriptional regulator n=1 Tax=Candidatus Pantoea multigeneris TaxID=2608357 RepID=A0ABX0RHT3_9GAMM|nr:LysR family transcriptional regulator [Pantoea multigeneris]NIF23703.1 LysR family transcriptional regulator [Pantoea multigeneris]